MTERVRLTRSELLKDLDVYAFDGNLEDVIDRLYDFRQTFSDQGFTNLRIDVSRWYEDVDVRLYGDRPETDKEMKNRIDNEIRQAAKKAAAAKRKADKAAETEEKERALLAQLKAKYGDG
jgi:hypothetical protein